MYLSSIIFVYYNAIAISIKYYQILKLSEINKIKIEVGKTANMLSRVVYKHTSGTQKLETFFF